VTNPKLAAQTRELCNPGYAVLHSGITRTPLWSAEHLTQPRIRASINLSREDSFRSDDRLPMAERAELDDYARSGWDRGHM
ncbi:DNA/RNA non-specific endonuclease, partial [Escherichia coli]